MFGLNKSFVDQSTDQSNPLSKQGSAFHGTQLPRPTDFPTMPSIHLEQIKHYNTNINAQFPDNKSVVYNQGLVWTYSEQAFNSSGGHKPAYNHPHITGLPN